MATQSYQEFLIVGMGLDPIHIGTGGSRLGRVDLTIVRDPVTRVPKIPGSSLAGAYRSYAAMHFEERRLASSTASSRSKPYFPDCAGLGSTTQGHCGKHDCPICITFGFARGQSGGFAGLAAFSDAHVLLFPVATREGPLWITSPIALRLIGCEVDGAELGNALYRESDGQAINLGWLLLEVKHLNMWNNVKTELDKKLLPSYIKSRLGLVSDKLFSHIVNSNLEVRTSVSIDPNTGAAEERALFSYEALPRMTVLAWTVTCRNPKHFKVGGQTISAKVNGSTIDAPNIVLEVVTKAHGYLEHLGIGGMGTRGMGRLRVLFPSSQPDSSISQQGQPDYVSQQTQTEAQT